MSRSTRRRFVQQSVALGLGLTAGLSGRAFAANDKISIACIGVRGRGNSVMNSFNEQRMEGLRRCRQTGQAGQQQLGPDPAGPHP